ncbi:hypothetical protein CALVIDRAFT_39463 [Calocera viscosa TUFC12733]|uniref:Uncharacterized protein n=1 Tax=Calocera viscosa (strain TUFC12733) TaxID=1330018 RepID=A0A167P0Y1_CALVF|nr:hypothetical protein CALVIDRAFT_39463 [Calocera viscosa TUFC12733]
MAHPRAAEVDDMSELTDAFQSLASALRHQYAVCKPLVLHQLHSFSWSLRLSLLSLQEDILRPFRTYADDIILLDSPDAGGWQTCIHVADEEVEAFRIQHKGKRRMSHGVRLARRPGSSTSPAGQDRVQEREEEQGPIMHLARLPRPPHVAQELILTEVRRVLAEDVLDDAEWVLRDAVKGAKRRCLREGAGLEWCDVWLARVERKRPGVVERRKEEKGEGRIVRVVARLVP